MDENDDDVIDENTVVIVKFKFDDESDQMKMEVVDDGDKMDEEMDVDVETVSDDGQITTGTEDVEDKYGLNQPDMDVSDEESEESDVEDEENDVEDEENDENDVSDENDDDRSDDDDKSDEEEEGIDVRNDEIDVANDNDEKQGTSAGPEAAFEEAGETQKYGPRQLRPRDADEHLLKKFLSKHYESIESQKKAWQSTEKKLHVPKQQQKKLHVPQQKRMPFGKNVGGKRLWHFKCEHCGKKCRDNTALSMHQRTHSGERPFPCHFCKWSFRRRGHRKRHEGNIHGFFGVWAKEKQRVGGDEAVENGRGGENEAVQPKMAMQKQQNTGKGRGGGDEAVQPKMAMQKQQNTDKCRGRGDEAVQPKMAMQKQQNTGKFFTGALPFNKPTYVELASPPFPNLFGVECENGWNRDVHPLRLEQITDITAKERLFFALWNRFIGTRPNRVLGVHFLPEILTRFVDHFGEQLARDELLGNLVEHCGMLQDNKYISGQEMVDVLMYAEEKTAEWRGN